MTRITSRYAMILPRITGARLDGAGLLELSPDDGNPDLRAADFIVVNLDVLEHVCLGFGH